MGKAALVTILVLHGGGWVTGSPASMEPMASDLRERGYNAWSVPYTLNNMNRAVSDVRSLARKARKRGPVVLYGASAGGTLAANLAVRGEVDGAIVAAAPTNLLTWRSEAPFWATSKHWKMLGMERIERKRMSPVYRVTRKAAPMIVFHAPDDTLVPYEQAVELRDTASRHQRDVRLVRMARGTGHSFPDRYQSAARQWIENRWPVR